MPQLAETTYGEQNSNAGMPLVQQASALQILSFYENIFFWSMTPSVVGLVVGVLVGSFAASCFEGLKTVPIFLVAGIVAVFCVYLLIRWLCTRSFKRGLSKIKNMLEKDPNAVVLFGKTILIWIEFSLKITCKQAEFMGLRANHSWPLNFYQNIGKNPQKPLDNPYSIY
jgi:hypothetical protein